MLALLVTDSRSATAHPTLPLAPWQVLKQQHLRGKSLVSSGERELKAQHSCLDLGKAAAGALRGKWGHSSLWCPKGDIQGYPAALEISDKRDLGTHEIAVRCARLGWVASRLVRMAASHPVPIPATQH